METLVIVPTYNEKENIAEIVGSVLRLGSGVEILVVDDASPDGTGAVVDALAAANPRVHVLHRAGKLGLGSAYITGFKWALANTDARFVFEMDADFSHDPNAIPQFLAAAADADLVIGSRYIKGITVVNWPLGRLILSYGANVYTRIVTGLPLRDATGGFKCFRREVLERLPLDVIRSDGYSFQIEVNYLAWKQGFRIVEIPILFVDRRVGISKMSKKIVWEAAFMVWRIRFMNPRRWK
ncbi:MAG: polyprenol monophosphomannose synthase [Candidatus Latescibacterota bacterium]|jgi:dolichol-phosphate mannosyltransferase|nr:MAG: polyprenol monophosphomannose synthase [Candidatus Latescibacterota bacterium]